MTGTLLGALTTIMVLFLVVHSFQALLLACAVPELWSHWRLGEDEYFRTLVGSDALPPISVIATVAGGGGDAVRLTEMLLALEYPRHEVVVVHDGSDDGTMERLHEALSLYQVAPAFAVHLRTERVLGYYRSHRHQRLLVVDKTRGGRADAMNAGMNAARYPHALAVGRNIEFEPDALLRLTRPFLLNRDVVAVAGALRPADAPANGWLGGLQRVEYLRTFLHQRLGWNRVASNLLFPGNAAVFKREHIFAVGGFRRDVEVPALDLAIRLHRHLTGLGVNPRMPVLPDRIARTRVPGDTARLRHARQAWQRGLVRALAASVGMTLNPEYGAFGVVALPYFWVAIVLAPVLELVGYVLLLWAILAGAATAGFVAAYLAAVLGYGMLLSVWSVVLEAVSDTSQDGSVARLLACALAESFGYRQRIAWYRATAFLARRPAPDPSLNATHG